MKQYEENEKWFSSTYDLKTTAHNSRGTDIWIVIIFLLSCCDGISKLKTGKGIINQKKTKLKRNPNRHKAPISKFCL